MHFLCFGWFSPRLSELLWVMSRLIFSLPSSTNKAQRAQRLAYWYRPGLEIFGTLQLDCNVRQCTIFASICNTRNYENSQSLSYPQRSSWMCYHIHVIIISFLFVLCLLSWSADGVGMSIGQYTSLCARKSARPIFLQVTFKQAFVIVQTTLVII